MTREEAPLVRLRLMAQRAFGAMVENRRGGSEEAQKDLDAIDWAIATIQSKIARPQPDPDTGLVPCGCGGKPHIINSSGYSRRLYVECGRCDIMLGVEATGDCALQGIYRYDDQIIKDWNRAMGWKGGLEVDDD